MTSGNMVDTKSSEIPLVASFLGPQTTTATSSSDRYRQFYRHLRLYTQVLYKFQKVSCHSKSPKSALVSGPYAPLLPAPPSIFFEPFSRTSSCKSWLAIEIDTDKDGEDDNSDSTDKDGEGKEQPLLQDYIYHTEEEQLIHDPINKIVKERDLRSLRQLGGVSGVASTLNSNLETGIEEEHASQGWNEGDSVCANGFCYHLLKALNRYTIFLLFLSAGLSFGVEMKEGGVRNGWHDGVAILVTLFLLVIFPPVAICLKERKLQKKLRKVENRLEVKVIRRGVPGPITVSNLKKGDIVCLEKGDRVPADGLFVNGEGLEVDEVLNSKIDSDANPFLYAGSKVSEGHGRMLVTSVGGKTTLGEMLRLMTENCNQRTFLEDHIEKPNTYTDNLALSVSVLIAAVVMISLLSKRQHKNDDVLPDLKGNTKIDVLIKIFESIFLRPRGRVRILAGALTAVVIGIQHTMPFAITVSFTLWNEKILSVAKPQNVSACGTLGLVSVFCINAAGRLICERVKVCKFVVGEEDLNSERETETDQAVIQALFQGIGLSARIPEISSRPADDLQLLNWVKSKWGTNMELLDLFSVHGYRRLSSNKKGDLVLLKKEGDDETLHMHLRGDASTILNLCSHYYDYTGLTHSIEDRKRNFERVIKDMEGSGLRAIAFACKQTEYISEVTEDGMHLLAIVGLQYTGLEELKVTVNSLKEAGILIKLVSGDEVSVVRAIACELGMFLSDSDHENFEGEQFRDLGPLMEKIEEVMVIGSCLSEDMLLIIKSLQQRGHVVAFYGGTTITDIPAIKEADVGITKQSCSTELARESSDIVIPNEDSLLKVLQVGRCHYYNIQKFTELQLTACISGLLINLAAAIFSWDTPLTAIQLIWVNLFMSVLGGLMMVIDLTRQEPPSNSPPLDKRTRSLVTVQVWKHILIQAFYQASVLLILHVIGLDISIMSEDVWKSSVFNAFMLCQLVNQLKAMNLLSTKMLEVLTKSHWFVSAFVGVLVLQVLVVEFGRSLAGGVRLDGVNWAICLLIAALPWIFESGFKAISSYSSNWYLHSDGSNLELLGRRPLSIVTYWGFPFFVLFFISFTYYFNPDKAKSFR